MLVEMSVNSSAGLIDTTPDCESDFEPQPATRMTRTRIAAQKVRTACDRRIIVSPLFLALWKNVLCHAGGRKPESGCFSGTAQRR